MILAVDPTRAPTSALARTLLYNAFMNSEYVEYMNTSSRQRPRWLLALPALAIVVVGACTSSLEPNVDSVSSKAVLGTAESFAVLGGSTVTNTGPTTVVGNLGVDPGLAVTGFPPGLISGTFHKGDNVALQAQKDTTAAYNTLAGQAVTLDLTGKDLGGMTLGAGVYHFSSSAQLTGTLTLDAKGNPNAEFVFQIGSTLTTASNSSVIVINGANDCKVFWQVGSSATLGTGTAFKGNIVALTSITLNTSAKVSGRALARNGAVTMDSNAVSTLSCTPSADAGVDSSSLVDSSPSPDAPTTICCGSASAVCGGACVNLNDDSANCGSCGNACAGNQVCDTGSCVACATLCNGVCADLANCDTNCGQCGKSCKDNQTCSNGSCVQCKTLCNGSCADNDEQNCGSCGNVCASGQTCQGGSCVCQ